jgi:hypothetical protein
VSAWRLICAVGLLALGTAAYILFFLIAGGLFSLGELAGWCNRMLDLSDEE